MEGEGFGVPLHDFSLMLMDIVTSMNILIGLKEEDEANLDDVHGSGAARELVDEKDLDDDQGVDRH